ncbi:MAG: hypothetical protein QOJ54_1360 [Aliidongia sp.]|jgi:hypothetical protein|nr:hypothetical protein [Aliidongia sp.]
MRLAFSLLPIALFATGCSSDSETAATPIAVITLEYSARDPDAAAVEAQKQCAVYSRTAQRRADGEGTKPNVITFDCR